MSYKSQEIPHLLNGVSELAPSRRLASQVEEQVNALACSKRGLGKRPPSEHQVIMDSTPTNYGNAFLHTINRDDLERYRVVIYNGTIKVFDSDGSPITVLLPNGVSYLASSTPYQTFRAVTIEDETFILSRDFTVLKDTTTADTNDNDALLYVKDTDFETTFQVYVDSYDIDPHQTPSGTTPADRMAINTTNVAASLLENLYDNASFKSLFTVTQYGSTLHIERKNGQTFDLGVIDGLDGKLIAIKDKIQRFTDLPPNAPDGFTVEITGDASTEFDNYWVRFNDNDGLGTGVWEEIVKPGELNALDASTMPHVLERGRGDVLTGLISLGAPMPTVTEGDEENDTLTEGWATSLNGAESERTMVANDDDLFSSLDDADGSATDYTIGYDVHTADMPEGEYCYLEIYYNDGVGSTNWTLSEITRHYYAGGYYPNETHTINETLAADYDLRVVMKYGEDETPQQAGENGTFTLHAAGASVPGVAYIAQANAAVIVDFGADTIYSAGITVTVTNNGNGNPHLVGSSDETGTQVATAMQILVDNDPDTTCTDNGDGSITIDHASATPTVTAVTNFDDSITFVSGTSLGLETDALVGLTMENTTDGSSDVILSNTDKTIVTDSGLTGGSGNNFGAGDECKVTTTSAYFAYREVDWEDRVVGDLTTNPFPTFINKKLKEIFFTKNRLGVTAGPNVIMAESGTPENFFRTTVQQLADGDVIDVRSTGAHDFHSVVEFDGEPILHSGLQQFALRGEPLLTPKTARLDKVTDFECDRQLRPLVLGKRMLFAQVDSGSTRVTEFWKKEDDTTLGNDLTAHTPSYLAGSPIQWAGSEKHGFLALLTDDDKANLFVFTDLIENDERILGGWSRWEFATTDEILGIDVIDNTLGMVVKRDEGIFFETINIDAGYDARRYVDRRMDQTVATPVFGGTHTVWTLPCDFPAADGTLQVVNQSTGEVYTSDRPAGYEVESADDGSGAGAAPDEGLLVGGFLTRVGGQYALEWGGGSAVRKWYTTEFFSNNFELYADMTRNASGNGLPGIAFLVKDASNMMMICAEDQSATTVDFLFKRYDTGGDQDPAILEAGVTWNRSAAMRIGVRCLNGVLTGFRADAVTGDNEVSLGTITETSSPTWIDHADHKFVGVLQHWAVPSNNVYWDNITVSEYNDGEGTVRVQNQDLSSTDVHIGWQYEKEATLSELFYRGFKGVAKITGILRLKTLTVEYMNSQDFTISVQRDAETALEYDFASASDTVLEEGTKRVPVKIKSDHATLKIINDTPNPSFIQGLQWEGNFTDRNKR